jgi:hypothetical protein
MNVQKTLLRPWPTSCVTITLPAVHADDWNQTTRFPFSQPVQIPGQALPAGRYRFRLANTDNRHLVQIFREDRTLVATFYSIPRMRDERAAEVAITLADCGETQLQAMVAWFFVGEAEGHEFVYAKQGKARTCSFHSHDICERRLSSVNLNDNAPPDAIRHRMWRNPEAQ